jgi:hypothetical protein
MGLGFVLLVWACIGTILAAVAGATLAAICFFVQKLCRRRREGWVLVFAITPFFCGLYCFLAFIGYGIWCETQRGVAFGIGDDFHFPIDNGYSFHAIDTMNNPWLETPAGAEIHQDFEAIGAAPPMILLRQAANRFILIDTKTRIEKAFATEPELTQAVQGRGLKEVKLMTPDDFYRRWRFGILDLIAGTGIILPPIIAFIILSLRFWKALRTP